MNSRDLQIPTYLVMTNTEPEEWCAVIAEEPQLIGRSKEAGIRIPQRFRHVSRRHAEIWWERRGVRIRDLGSRAGTSVNGIWIDGGKDASVVVGDRLWMGCLELDVVEDVSLFAQVLAESGRSVHEHVVTCDGSGDTFMQRSTMPLQSRFTLATLS